MNNYKSGIAIFTVIIIMSFVIGDFIMKAAFFGCLMLIGLAFMVESIRPLKWLVTKTSRVIDVIIFVATILATASLGLNITAGLTVAGLGFTLVYAPYLRERGLPPKPRKRMNKTKIKRNGKAENH